MVSWALCVGLLLLYCPWSLEAKLHHTVIFPSELRSDQSEEVCIQLEGAQGESRVEILLNVEDKNTTLAEKTFQDSTFTCIKIQVPDFKTEEQSVVATLVAVIENAGETIKKSAKVLLKKAKSGRLIQTDRAVYKPGQKASSSVDEPTTTLTEGRGAKKEEEERVQSYFPETFPFGDLAVGMGGSAELQMKAPDTITDCNGGAVCLGPTRFARSSPTSLRVFQPFSVDVTLPSSVVQGEPFILTASIFNYMQDPMKIQSTLNSDIEEMPCEECHHSSCIGADESKTFSWIINLVSLGEVNFTVNTEALDTKELCKDKIPIVPKQGGKNTIVKSLLVQAVSRDNVPPPKAESVF
ncbi:alpha-2-macroglobulin-P-like isoform X5 [Lithobates pipiens]